MASLEVSDLYRTFDGFTLGPIDLELEPGRFYGLIGPNGAGKSTLLRSILGLMRPDSGSVVVGGVPANAESGLWKQAVGYVGDRTPLIERWSGRRNLSTVGRFYETWSHGRAAGIADRLGLDLDRPARTYSTGERAKLALALALGHEPTLLLLDEAAAGLDPVARDNLMELLHERMQDERFTVLYATHHVAEIERLIGDLVVMHSGRIVAREVADDLEYHWRRVTFSATKLVDELPGRVSIRRDGSEYDVVTRDESVTLDHLRRIGAASIMTSRLSVEQICVQLLKTHMEV